MTADEQEDTTEDLTEEAEQAPDIAANSADSAKECHKSTDAVVTERVVKVYDLLLSGAEKRHIRQYAAQAGWNVSERQLSRYVKSATDALKLQAEVHMDHAFALEISSRNRLIMRGEQAHKEAKDARARMRKAAESIEDKKARAFSLAELDVLESSHPVGTVGLGIISQVLMDRAKLTGAYAPEKHTIGMTEGPVQAMSDEELDRIADGDDEKDDQCDAES